MKTREMTKMCILSKILEQMFVLFFILKHFGYKVTTMQEKSDF